MKNKVPTLKELTVSGEQYMAQERAKKSEISRLCDSGCDRK